MVTTITNYHELISLRDQWNEVLGQISEYTPFQTFEYNMASWDMIKNNDISLYIIVYIRQKDNKIQAIFPFYLDQSKSLRFINDLHTDFCDAIVCDEAQRDYHLWSDVCQCILSTTNIKSLRLNNISVESKLLSFFRFFLSQSIVYSSNAFSDVKLNVVKDTAKTMDALPYLRSKEKARIKNVYKKVDVDSLKIYSHLSGIEFPKNILLQLIGTMINEGWRSRQYFSDDMIGLFENLYENNLLQVHLTTKDNIPIAANLWLSCLTTNAYIDWISIYADKEKNLDNLLQSLEYFASSGATINFARGLYQYKTHNFRPCVHNLYSLRWSRSLWGQLCDVWAVAFYNLKQIAKKLIRG